MGRGVGFARYVIVYELISSQWSLTNTCPSFEDRATCTAVVTEFNNKPIKAGNDDYVINIRYADSPEQKTLKQQVSSARAFRSQGETLSCTARGTLLTCASQEYLAATQQISTLNEFEAALSTQK